MSVLDPTECMETAEEQRVHSPPASLVPRLHVLHSRRLSHNNPLLPAATMEDNGAGETIVFSLTVKIYTLDDSGQEIYRINQYIKQ